MPTIELIKHMARMDAQYAPLLEPILSQQVRRFVPGGPLGHQQVRHTDCYSMLDGGQLYFPAGLAQRVQRHLEGHGHRVHLVNQTDWWHLDRADKSLLDNDEWGAAPRDALIALTQQPRGQLVVGNLDEIAATIALMCRVFAQENILVVAKNRATANWLHGTVTTMVDRPIDREHSVAKDRRPRVLIVTSQLASTIGGEDFRILIYTDVESALHASVDWIQTPCIEAQRPDYRTSLLQRWPHATAYLVRDQHRRLSPAEAFRVEATYGAEIFTVFEEIPAPVMVAFLPFIGAAAAPGASALESKRQLYWHNPDWNTRIVAVADQIMQNDLPIALPAGVGLMPEPRIAILTETAEHARALQRVLRRGDDGEGANPADSAIQADLQICTFTSAVDYGLDADVIVRADGTDDWPLQHVLERAPEGVYPLILIDFRDERNEHCAALTRSRAAAYERAGYRSVLPLCASEELLPNRTETRTRISSSDTVSALESH